ALTAASCIIGPLVPPSIPMVLYGVMANASVGALFLAGVVPGVLTAIVLMLYVAWVSHRRNYRSHSWAGWGHILVAFRRAFLALVTPLIIMGGIFGGIFTPTEAAGVAALYSLILGMFIYRELHWRDLPRIFREAVNTSAVVGFLVACASLFSWVLAREQVPQQIAAALLAVSQDRDVLLLIINLLLLGLGCIMEGIAIMILVVPVLMPIAAQVGIDPVHLGVVVVMNLMIGILTPPFGVGLFVVSKVGNIPFHVLARAIMPFLVPLLAVQGIVTWFPQTFLWLPRMVFG
ncbi:MAG: TRAP transporter large permease, partial [Betaproteobacteria bacterium]